MFSKDIDGDRSPVMREATDSTGRHGLCLRISCRSHQRSHPSPSRKPIRCLNPAAAPLLAAAAQPLLSARLRPGGKTERSPPSRLLRRHLDASLTLLRLDRLPPGPHRRRAPRPFSPVVVVVAGPSVLRRPTTEPDLLRFLEAAPSPLRPNANGSCPIFFPLRFNSTRSGPALTTRLGPPRRHLPTGAHLADAYLQPLAACRRSPARRYWRPVFAITGSSRSGPHPRPRPPLPFRPPRCASSPPRSSTLPAPGHTQRLGASVHPAHGERASRVRVSALPDVLAATGGVSPPPQPGRRFRAPAAHTLLALRRLAEPESRHPR